jgi:hypothetical protein
MKRLLITAFAAAALTAAATEVLWSHSTRLSVGTAAMPSLEELYIAACPKKLPIEECEDTSLAHPTAAKRQEVGLIRAITYLLWN